MRPSCAKLALLTCLTIGPAFGAARADGEKNITRPLVLNVGSTQLVRMTTRQRLKKVFNDAPGVVLVLPAPDDPTAVLVRGLAPGRARITLVGEDGRREVCTVGERIDRPPDGFRPPNRDRPLKLTPNGLKVSDFAEKASESRAGATAMN